MADYISRKAAVIVCDEQYKECLRKSDFCGDAAAWNICDGIKSIPAADVEPVRHGRWEPGNPICPVCGEDKFKGLDADIWSDWTPACCPNCGAKMQGAENE